MNPDPEEQLGQKVRVLKMHTGGSSERSGAGSVRFPSQASDRTLSPPVCSGLTPPLLPFCSSLAWAAAPLAPVHRHGQLRVPRTRSWAFCSAARAPPAGMFEWEGLSIPPSPQSR